VEKNNKPHTLSRSTNIRSKGLSFIKKENGMARNQQKGKRKKKKTDAFGLHQEQKGGEKKRGK
jgi:hypothetical protein